MAKLVSKIYGDALFELAIEKDNLDSMWEEIIALSQIWKENPDFASLFAHPRIAVEEKLELIKNVFSGKASDDIMGFLSVLVEKGHATDLESVLSYFTDRAREYKNIGVAYVTSATELSEAQKKSVEERLLDVTKYVKFEMNFDVDESLIGGIVIRIGDRILDGSIKQKLNNMVRELSNIQLG